MHTQTHMLLGAVVFGRRASGRTTLAAAGGGLAPDLASFVLVGWAAAGGMSAAAIFRTAYFSEPWQAIMAPSHSVPLWLAAFVLAAALRARTAAAFAGSGLLHQPFDFALHADDPHRHFWPLSDWRFESPASYWDPAHHGVWVQPVELVLGLTLVVLLWRRWPSRWARAALVLLALLYALQAVAVLVFIGGGASL